MKLIENPNLPYNRVKTVLLSGEYKEIIEEINKLNISTITTSACEQLPKGEQYHADMQAVHINNEIMVLNECKELIDKLIKNDINVNKTNVNVQNKYPFNVLLNCVMLDKFVIMNKKTVSIEIYNLCEKINKDIVNVNQGYTKCSTALIRDNAIITSDNGIYNECKKHKIDVLKIKSGYIDLPNYDYGFIGGTCTLIDKNNLLFTGNIKKHPDYELIKSYCLNYNVYLNTLTNNNLIDIGGILPLSYE